LNKHKSALRRAVPAATIIDGLELISGTGYNTEKAAAVINSGWAFDPVHPSKHVYAKMALNLLEKIASQNQHKPKTGRGAGASATQAAGEAAEARMAADAATGVVASPAPATVAAAASKPPGANSGRRAAGVTASGLLSPPAQKMGARTAASNMTAGHTGDAAAVTAAAATKTMDRTEVVSGSAVAAADAAVGAGLGMVADTNCPPNHNPAI
jgi:hypothetical protein